MGQALALLAAGEGTMRVVRGVVRS